MTNLGVDLIERRQIIRLELKSSILSKENEVKYLKTNDSSTILSINNLSKSYSGMKVVDKLSFDVTRGEIFGFLGPNGAGKTTTINMICGLLKADEGDIIINDLSIRNNPKEARALIGMCPQKVVIWKELTCIEQIEFMGAMYDVPGKIARGRGIELLEEMGLIEKKDKRGKTLSGGMQRRLNIILALIHDPKLLILDEPEAGLDPQSRVLVRDYIKNLAKKKTIILTTHNMDEAERMADRVAIIDGGKLLVVNTPEKLKSGVGEGDILEIKTSGFKKDNALRIINLLKPVAENVKFSEDMLIITDENILEIITNIINILASNKIIMEDVRLRKKTLEDVFITLTGRGLRE